MKTKLTSVQYLGFTAMDRRFSTPMLPWLLQEIKKLATRDKLSLAVEGGCLKAYNDNFEPVLVHSLTDIIRKSQVAGSPEQFFYIVWNERQKLLQCFLFCAATVHDVTELFSQMKEPSPSSSAAGSLAVTRNAGFQRDAGSAEHLPWNTAPALSLPSNCHLSSMPENGQLVRTSSNASVLASLSADLSPSDSHFFEVLYIGKVRVSQRKVPDSLIDDALQKFSQHESDKTRQAQMRRNSLLSSQASTISSNPGSSEDIVEEKVADPLSSQGSNASQIFRANVTLSCTSTTPLEPDKHFQWKSEENLRPETPRNSPEIDQEFDNFTKERVEKSNEKHHIKKPIPVALEPNILILNVPTTKNSLTTLTEDENEGIMNKSDDIGSIISDTASSITQFCLESYRKDLTPPRNEAIKEKENIKDLDAIEICPPAEYNKIVPGEMARADVEDTKVSFDELTRNPKLLQRSKTGLNGFENRKSSMPENKPFLRDRSASIGTLNLSKTPIAHLIGEQNRTMLFQVGRSELRLISPDRKQILLHKAFRDVASCVLGRESRDHFGFICREVNSDAYVCYVFKCASDGVANEVINAIKQAFTSHAETVKKTRERSPNMTCEHCPMLWYHRLCHDVEGMNEKKTHAFILRRIEQLPEEEQDQIITKYQGGTNHMYEPTEHNAFLMMLLRAHSEAKQLRHVHDTAENRSEFLNQYLGGSTIFMKARRSLTSGFDHLLKRKASKDDLNHHAAPIHVKKEASPLPVQDTSSEPSISGHHLSPELARSKSMSPAITVTGGDVPDSTSATNCTNEPVAERADDESKTSQDAVSGSPMMDIFLKVGDTKSAPEGGGGGAGETSGATWRQAIFQRVVSPEAASEELSPASLLGLPVGDGAGAGEGLRARRSRQQLRELWRMAIGQTVLLVRMERENARLRESEESSAVRRIKLEYTELGAAGAPPVWDALLSARERSATLTVARQDYHMLKQCVRQGVPRMCRGGVWYYLAEQHCLRSPPPDPKKFPMYNVPYHTLLSGLTMHQHAILIDLGRTFPQHSYFASALGPGQLALYNLLKAYSLLDPEVGYCQGLSFVAGVLLLHMEEAEAFTLLRHLMFRRGLRKQYLPDMSALQIQLYQLSRLLRDHEPELHAKLEQLDIAPALYAAPWMLTLFTSQFPLGFVVRVFDLIFLESLDVVFAVSLALLSAHKDGLMLCESCEEAAEYLKHKLPDVDKTIYDKVMKKVYSLDISRQLTEYAVEYGVLREEMPRIALLSSLQEDYQQLERENQKVMSELDTAMESISNYQSSQSRLESQVRSLEQQLGLMSRYMLAHYDRKTELPGEIKRICQNYNKKVGFGSKITTFSSKFSNNEHSEEEEEVKTKSILKTGMSTPNLFAKLTKDEIVNIKENNKVSLDSDRKKPYPMKKSISVNSGLVAPPVKKTLKIVDDKSDENQYKRSHSIRMDDPIRDTLKDIGTKNSGFFANSHEHIRQERMFAQQLKNDFDENLKRLDQKLYPNRSYIDNISMFQGQKSMSLNLDRKILHQNNKNLEKTGQVDSGFATPMSPLEDKKDDECSIVSHPLSDCDVDIKFDGHSTQLKCLRPILKPTILGDRSNSFESQESKQTI